MRESAGRPSQVAEIPLAPEFGLAWRIALALSGSLVLLLAYALAEVTLVGTGLWGTNNLFVWGFDLINYSWWIGIANGGNLVAAILVLRGHDLRSAVNRVAESSAFAALICAGIFPIFHLGRPWLFYWVFPFPYTFDVWPQFRSTLTWDFWAISAYAIITFVFWYIGLIPDLAILRDRARRRTAKMVYGVAALGWRNSLRHWTYHQSAYRLTAILVLPLILVMQTTVALEHAVMLVPGWHEAWQPAHFIVTGLASGLATVLLISVLLRRFLKLEPYITAEHTALMAKLLAATALVVGYVYAGWLFTTLLAETETREAGVTRIAGPYGPFFWSGLATSVVIPQLLWFGALRRSSLVLAVVSLCTALGIWLDRFSLLVGGLQHGYLRAHLDLYWPTVPEFFLLAGTLGLFAAFLLLFVRYLPAVSIFQAELGESSEPPR